MTVKFTSGAAFEHYWKHRISHKTSSIEHVHVVQKRKNKLIIGMVRNSYPLKRGNEFIISELKSLLGDNIEIEFKGLSSILTGSKYRFTTYEILNSI